MRPLPPLLYFGVLPRLLIAAAGVAVVWAVTLWALS